MLRIALIDGDPAIRAGRRLMIDSQDDFHLIYEESDAGLALEKIPNLLVDVIIIDQRLKGFDGIELSEKLVKIFSEKRELCPSIIITGTYATPELLVAAVRAGASDVVTLEAPMSELLKAIRDSISSRLAIDFKKFDAALIEAKYISQTNPQFLLLRSKLGNQQQIFLGELENGLSLNDLRNRQGLNTFEFREYLDRLLIDLGMATLEQLQVNLLNRLSTTED